MNHRVNTPKPGRRRRHLSNGARAGALLLLAGIAAPGSHAQVVEAYMLDPDFPQAGSFDFRNVSWTTLSPDGERLFMVQRGNPAVSVWSLDGDLLSTWSTTDLGEPHSLTFQTADDGTDYAWITDMAPPVTASESYGHCVKKFTLDGTYRGSIGTCGETSQGTGLDPVQFDKVTDVAFDSGGLMWVTDGDLDGLNNRVLSIDPATATVLSDWSAPDNQPGSGEREFNLPHAIDVDTCDRVYVADALNHRIQIIRTDGTFLQELACFGDLGVYGLSLAQAPGASTLQMFVTASTTTFTGVGIASVFEVDPLCTAALPVPSGCDAAASWDIALPKGTSGEALHAAEATANGAALFISPLGGDLLPQKWNRSAAIAE
ncbi:hypothetical protein [Stappia stellulata]|uniref:hypothetical protein n=1 Tax=Stappia stellulata TaxID=71235 RepID=UPI0004262C00|nr:hypothetical protein [Stappia stellulata]